MNSGYLTSDRVLTDLGGEFVLAFVNAVDGAREDFAEFRAWKPGWFVGFTNRFTANLLHERIWDRLIKSVSLHDGIHVIDREPVREGTLRTIGDAVLSFRDGKDNPIWAIQLRRDASTPAGFAWTPVAPDLPEIDLSGVTREVEEESGT